MEQATPPADGQKTELRRLRLALRSSAITCRERYLSKRYTSVAKCAILVALQRRRNGVGQREVRLGVLLALLALRRRRELWRWQPMTMRRYVRPPVVIAAYSNTDCWNKLGFRKEHLGDVIRQLGIPDTMICRNGSKFTGEEAFICYLARLKSSATLESLCETYGRENTQFSRVFHLMQAYLFAQWRHLLFDSIHRWVDQFVRWALAFSQHPSTVPLVGIRIAILLLICMMFDGTARAIRKCSPIREVRDLQRLNFNGRKHRHTLGFQSMSAPNGLTVSECTGYSVSR
jgi:hypothetical protein